MSDIFSSFIEAGKLIISMDKGIYSIIALSLVVTILSTAISAFLGVPLGVAAGTCEFIGKRLFTRFINTFMGLPPVVAGLVVYMLLSRKGPFGRFGMLFTPAAMVIAQVIIVTPIITGLTIAAINPRIKPVKETCMGLGIGSFKSMLILLHECRYSIISSLMAGYGRSISEVGAVMLVGGNIQNSTRVMTTAIVLETGKGAYDKALALGIVLMLLSFIINWIVQMFQEGK